MPQLPDELPRAGGHLLRLHRVLSHALLDGCQVVVQVSRHEAAFAMLEGEVSRAVNVLSFACDRGDTVPDATVRQVVADLERRKTLALAQVYGAPTCPEEEAGPVGEFCSAENEAECEAMDTSCFYDGRKCSVDRWPEAQ